MSDNELDPATPLSVENLSRMGSELPTITRGTSDATTQETQSIGNISRDVSRSTIESILDGEADFNWYYDEKC